MENYFKDRKIDSGFGASSRSMTTMDWLKKIEKEIEDRNKKKDGKGTSENSGVAGWGQVTNKSLGRDNQPEPAIEPREVGWDTPDNKPADTANDSKGKQKDKGNQKKDNHAGQGTQGKTQNVWIVPGGSKQPSQTVGGGGTGKGWDDEDKAGPTTESAPNNNSGNFVWGDEPPAGARIADPWQNPNIGASANIEQARSSGGDGWI